MSPTSGHVPVHLIVGTDPSLVSHTTTQVLDRVCGPDRRLAPTRPSPDDNLAALLQTTPMFGDRRVVLLQPRTLDDGIVTDLVSYLQAPVPTTVLVLATAKAPAALTRAVTAAGGQLHNTSPRKPAETASKLLGDGPVSLDRAAQALVTDHVGDDVSRIPALLTTLASAYGPDARIGTAEVEPFLGDAGAIPPWELTDAIDRGDPAAALRALRRLLRTRAPLAVLSSLHYHVERLFLLSAADMRSETDAVEFLGVTGSTYPVRKALRMLPRWGDPAAALLLVRRAGDDLRGGSAWPDAAVLDVLVGRLASRRR